MAENPDSAHGHGKAEVVKSAAVVALGILLSRVLGLVRDVMIARYFTLDIRDAFVNAFRLPNVFRRVFGEGALSASFIPVFVAEQQGEAARRLASGVFTILLAVVIPVCCFAVVFMEDILRALLGGAAYMSVPGKFELTLKLARIMFAFLALISVFAYFMAVLNGLRKFAVTALAPCLFNLAVIAAAFTWGKLENGIFSVAWAVLVGGALQVTVAGAALAANGYFPRLTLQWGSPEISRVLKAVAPVTLGISVLQLTTVVNMYFASQLPAGSPTYLYLADRILELPLSLFVVSLSSALLPSLAREWAHGDRKAMAETVHHFMKLILFMALPAAAGMLALAHPISEVLFLGREFKYDDAAKTAQVIQVYSFGLVVAAGVRILSQGFYAVRSVWFPAAAGLVALISHLMFAFSLTRVFGLTGLASASVLSSTVHLALLSLAYHKWIGSLRLRLLAVNVGKFSLCLFAMLAVIQVYGPLGRLVGVARPGSRAFVLLTTIALGGFTYMAAANFLGLPEYRQTIARVLAKLRKKAI